MGLGVPVMVKEKKKIAVLINGREHEALRVAVGLTLSDDEVHVYLMDIALVRDEAVDQNLEALQLLRGKVFTNVSSNPFEVLSTEEIAARLSEYDHVIPY
jgi:hypothetical protein